jgi:hypothetical protein
MTAEGPNFLLAETALAERRYSNGQAYTTAYSVNTHSKEGARSKSNVVTQNPTHAH